MSLLSLRCTYDGPGYFKNRHRHSLEKADWSILGSRRENLLRFPSTFISGYFYASIPFHGEAYQSELAWSPGLAIVDKIPALRMMQPTDDPALWCNRRTQNKSVRTFVRYNADCAYWRTTKLFLFQNRSLSDADYFILPNHNVILCAARCRQYSRQQVPFFKFSDHGNEEASKTADRGGRPSSNSDKDSSSPTDDYILLLFVGEVSQKVLIIVRKDWKHEDVVVAIQNWLNETFRCWMFCHFRASLWCCRH